MRGSPGPGKSGVRLRVRGRINHGRGQKNNHLAQLVGDLITAAQESAQPWRCPDNSWQADGANSILTRGQPGQNNDIPRRCGHKTRLGRRACFRLIIEKKLKLIDEKPFF